MAAQGKTFKKLQGEGEREWRKKWLNVCAKCQQIEIREYKKMTYEIFRSESMNPISVSCRIFGRIYRRACNTEDPCILYVYLGGCMCACARSNIIWMNLKVVDWMRAKRDETDVIICSKKRTGMQTHRAPKGARHRTENRKGTLKLLSNARHCPRHCPMQQGVYWISQFFNIIVCILHVRYIICVCIIVKCIRTMFC